MDPRGIRFSAIEGDGMTRLPRLRERLAREAIIQLDTSHGPYIARLICGRPVVHEALCPHRGGPLADAYLVGGLLICAWHRSTFHCADGRPLFGPAGRGLRVAPAHFECDDLIIAWPWESARTQLDEFAARARTGRTPAWVALEERYHSWTLAAAAEHAVSILSSAAPHRSMRVHRALLSERNEHACNVIQHLLVAALGDDIRDVYSLPAGLTVDGVAKVEAAHQLAAYAVDFLDGESPFDVLEEPQA
jgi:nitrite reductase/ring-hydroxylating ferredoxin subunit